MMTLKVAEAVAFAFDAGLDVRGGASREAALVSLALHASRTLDPGPFLSTDRQLAARAAVALAGEKREDLALQVLLWERDEEGRPDGSELPRPLRAYVQALQWAEGAGGPENLAWIRDVPRDFALREVLAKRLLLRAEGGAERRTGFASACLEAELAELPRVRSFARILRACVVARAPAVVGRALEGLGVLDPVDNSAEAQQLFEQLRGALAIVRRELEGASLRAAVEQFHAGIGEGGAVAMALLGAHLAGALVREGDGPGALELVEAAQRVVDRTSPRPRAADAALAYIRGAVGRPPGSASSPQPGLAQLPPQRRPSPLEMAHGAAEAARALRDPGPVQDALGIFDPEDIGGILPESGSASAVLDLFRTGAYLAGEGSGLAVIEELGQRLRRFRLKLAADIFVRALLADAAARLAARLGNEEAWKAALGFSARGLDRFEKAKMRGRTACEFIVALQTAPVARVWVDPGFVAVPLWKAPPGQHADGGGRMGSGSAQI
jgi:hypothetical protein